MLESDGLDVDVAVDGEKALGMLMQKTYDVILLDIVLPKLSGADIMENLAATRPELLAKIIVVTGMDVAEIRKLFPTVCYALGKPVIPSRLRDSIRSCLPYRRSGSTFFVA